MSPVFKFAKYGADEQFSFEKPAAPRSLLLKTS
jgi:hypothetical protein